MAHRFHCSLKVPGAVYLLEGINIDYQLNHERAISYCYMGATRLTSMTKLEHMATLSRVLLWEVLYD